MGSKYIHLIKRGLENPTAIPQYLIERTWRVWESLGFHIVPNHFYYPIPDTSNLRQKQPWNEEYSTAGVELKDEEQLKLLDNLSGYFPEYSSSGSGFESNGDGTVLWAMIRKFKPQRIIEVGSGTSTKVALSASERNEIDSNVTTEITAIEPYPSKELQNLDEKHNNLTLIKSRAEDIAVEDYCELESGDFLFIDSSHTLTTGNDVAHLYLKVLPQLPDGVFVHSHDIRFPSEYPKEWLLDKHRFWTEQYLLHAFLMFNDSFDVVWAGNHMSNQYPEQLEQSIPNYEIGEGWPGSFWIQRNP